VRNETSAALTGLASRINVAFEAYPDLKAQDNIAEAMRQSVNLQKEITAAGVLYNDTVATWNREIFAWPIKLIVAAKNEFTTRIPFIASAEVRAASREKIF
jgi:LemA protein